MLRKESAGKFTAADEESFLLCQKLENGVCYTSTMKICNDIEFHNKLMALLRFCFSYCCQKYSFYQNDRKQFDSFRAMISCQIGYFDQLFDLDGKIFSLKAHSLDFESMTAIERYDYFEAVLNYAWIEIFKDADDLILFKLKGFDRWINKAKNAVTKIVQ